MPPAGATQQPQAAGAPVGATQQPQKTAGAPAGAAQQLQTVGESAPCAFAPTAHADDAVGNQILRTNILSQLMHWSRLIEHQADRIYNTL